jgi:regulator of protease activity HflC (stomatin/prohibitin superfamily)
MEKTLKPMSGYLAVVLALASFAGALAIMANLNEEEPSTSSIVIAMALFVVAGLIFRGIFIVNPNHSRVCILFGKYAGTVKANGLCWVNPFYQRVKVSLRSENLESPRLKVNDKMGNPIEIAVVVVWQVSDTFKATFDVEDYEHYVKVQSEAAIRHLASSCAYDHMEDEHAALTLRDGGEQVTRMLEAELLERLSAAGIIIREARISHLAYAAEIAGAMLQRQQATAIVAARFKIVEGAVGMVELALEHLSRKQIVHLDEEKKAAMVSNLMVVLCGEKGAQPILNTGTLYQ